LRVPAAGGAVSQRAAVLAVAAWLVTAAASAETPSERLWQAARDGDAAALGALLDAGADPDAEFRQGGTALLFAAQRGHAEAVRLLLARGADVNARETLNNTTALHFGISYPEVVRALVEKGADVNAHDLQADQAPLWWAVAKRQAVSASLILASGRVDARNLGNALEMAERIKNPEIAAAIRAALAKAGTVASWPQFRGRGASGVADGEKPPVRWSTGGPAGEPAVNVRWTTAIPGLGHSSPVVWGDRLFVTTAVSAQPATDLRAASPMESAADMSVHTLKVYALDRQTGAVLWEKTAWSGVPRTKRHPKNSFASATPATDGRHLVVLFGSHGLFCFDLDGNLLWQKDLGLFDTGFFFDPEYQWGDASSPVLFRDSVILQSDRQKDSFLAAFSLSDGTLRWRTARDELPSWGSPTLFEGPDGGAELVTNGIRGIRGYDPATGKELWHLATENSMIAGSTPVVALGDLFVVGNGYRPLKPIYAIRRGVRGEIAMGEEGASPSMAWSRKAGGPYYITPLAYGEHLYVLTESGVLTLYYARTGEEIYRKRVGDKGATFSASPVAADGRLYLASEDGDVYVVKAGIEYQLEAVNPVGELMMATPAIADGMIYIRTRQHVFGIGAAPAATTPAAPAVVAPAQP
jgi:outer membrane protein assembly factor BamB